MILVNFGIPDFGGHSISPKARCWLGGLDAGMTTGEVLVKFLMLEKKTWQQTSST